MTGFAYGFVADGELQPVPDEQVVAVQRLVERRLPEEHRHGVEQMLGIAS